MIVRPLSRTDRGVRLSRPHRIPHSLSRGVLSLPASVPPPRRSGRGSLPAVPDWMTSTSTICHPLGLRPLHGRRPSTLLHELLTALHERLGRLLRHGCRLALHIGFPCFDGQPVGRLLAVGRRLCRPMGRGMDRGDIPRLDFRRFRSHPWGWRRIHGNITDSRLPCPDLGQLRSGLPHGRHIRVGSMNSGLSGFDLNLPHPLPWERLCPAAFRRPSTGTTFPGGNSFPCLDPGLFPWGRLMGGGWPCRRFRERRWICRRLRRGRI